MLMVEADIYKDMDEDEVRMHVQLDGWTPVKLIHAPGDVYEPHKHPEEKLLAILAGSMKLRINYQWTTLLVGDKVVIPGNVMHEAIIGKNGSTFFWAERLPEETGLKHKIDTDAVDGDGYPEL